MTWLFAIGKFIKAIPWQAWAIAAVIAAAWYYGEVRADQREAEVNARWQDAQDKADREAIAAELKRDAASTAITSKTDWQAHEATVDTRTTTAAAVERVRHESHAVAVPVACPTGVPPRVSAEGRAAVARVRAAAGAVRARPHP